MTIFVDPPTSNTTVSIPDAALNPTEGAFQNSNMDDRTKVLFTAAAEEGRDAFFFNPCANAIVFSADAANTLNTAIWLTGLSSNDKTNVQTLLVGITAAANVAPGANGVTNVSFSTAIANTSIVEFQYRDTGTRSHRDTFQLTNDTTTGFSLSANPSSANAIGIFVNGVYQANTSGNFTIIVGEDADTSSGGVDETPSSTVLSALMDFYAHTNRLSGLAEAETDGQIDLEGVLSVGASLNIILNSLNGTSSAGNVYYALASLFAAQRILEIGQRLQLIQDTANAGVLDVDATLTELTGYIEEIAALIQADVDFYNAMIEQMKSSSLTTIVESIAASPEGKYLIRELIGTQVLKDAVL